MIKTLQLKNYRCFENSSISFKGKSIVVGNNNAGKSTVIEALRIISNVAVKFKRTVYTFAPIEFGLPNYTKGINVNTETIRIDLRTIVYQYKDREGEYAQIVATFDHNICIHAYISRESCFAIISKGSKQITSNSSAKNVENINIFIMPQIGLIREDEKKLDPDNVRSSMYTRLASLHFRNEILLYKDQYYENFKKYAETTWHGLRIQDISFNYDESRIELQVFDGGYSAEIGMMGSGLQMWLQIMWFISHCPEESTVVLDEPDVYMHPDLQRKLCDLIESKFCQSIIATHSLEIISMVQPKNIVIVDKNTRQMKYADSLKAVQSIVENLGGQQNLSLIRLGSAKKCVFVEGQDRVLLAKFQEIIGESGQVSINDLPFVELGGWQRFEESLGAAKLFNKETGGAIATYCILDRDYHLQDEIDELYQRAQQCDLQLHVWEKKEIENYIVTPHSLFALTGLPDDEYNQFCDDLDYELEELHEQTIDKFMDEIVKRNRAFEPSKCRQLAKEETEKHWNTLEEKLSIVNGKALISLINKWFKEKYKKNISRYKMICELKPEDICDEMKTEIFKLVK